jgi:hypothetical protein
MFRNRDNLLYHAIFWPLAAILAIFGAFCVVMYRYILENSTMSEFLAKILLAAILAIFGAFCVSIYIQENSTISELWPKSPLAAKFGNFRRILPFTSIFKRSVTGL